MFPFPISSKKGEKSVEQKKSARRTEKKPGIKKFPRFFFIRGRCTRERASIFTLIRNVGRVTFPGLAPSISRPS